MNHATRRRYAPRAIAVFILAICTLQPGWGQPPARDKVSAEILAHQKIKQARPGRSVAEHNTELRRLGLNPANLDAEDCALYATRPLRADELPQLATRGIRVIPGLWIPPVPGKHPLGFHLATVDYSSLNVIRTDDRFAKLESTESARHPQNDLGKIMMHADEVQNGNIVIPRTGAGVKIAIADSGIDLTHPDLPAPLEAYDVTTGLGLVEWMLRGTNVANTFVPHGTHIAGTVLGSGLLSGGKYKGMAPGASFYFYKVGDESTAIASATDIIKALNRAVTVGANIFTLSYGGFGIYMDGSEPMEQAVDAASASGMTVFVAVGGYSSAPYHASLNVAPGTTANASGFTVFRDPGSTIAGVPLRVIWRDGNAGDANITLACTNLDAGETLIETSSGSSPRGTETKLYTLTTNIAEGASRTSKTYVFTVQNTAASGSTPLVHFYSHSGLGIFTNPDPTYTVMSPAIADSAIAVGGVSQRFEWTNYQGGQTQEPGYFPIGSRLPSAGQGPRIDGAVKPDIVAPGGATISARDSTASVYAPSAYRIDNDGLNLDGCGPANYLVMSGTSVATAMAAGSAALILENNPSLTPAQLKQALISTAGNSASPNGAIGYGLIDVLAALKATTPDPLTIVASGLTSSGPVGGPFTPGSKTYTLANNSGTPLNWTAAKTQPWVTVSPSSGTLNAVGSTTVTVSIDSSANALPTDSYSDTLTFTNTGTGFAQTFPITLTVGTPHAALFDSYTDAYPYTATLTPDIVGTAFTLNGVGGTSNITVAGGTAYLVTNYDESYTNIRLTVSIWGAASGETSDYTIPAFSNLLGTFSFDLGPFTTVAGTVYPYRFTLPAPAVFPSQTGGITLRWQGDRGTGSGLRYYSSLRTFIRSGPALAAGTTDLNGYYWDKYGESDGNFQGNSFRGVTGFYTNVCPALQLFGPPIPPMAVTNAATIVGSSSATLNASVNPAGTATTASFQYGMTTAYGSTATITLSPGNGTTAQNISAALTGLMPGTLYHFRVTANNSYGTTTGRDLTFTTPASGFTTWAQNKFTQIELTDSAISGANAVYGLDGLSNLLKYALGLEPKTDISSGMPEVSVVGSEWVFTYVRPASITDVTYSVEVSTDLVTWTTAGVIHEQVSVAGGSATWRGRYPLSSADTAYFRLNVTQP